MEAYQLARLVVALHELLMKSANEWELGAGPRYPYEEYRGVVTIPDAEDVWQRPTECELGI